MTPRRRRSRSVGIVLVTMTLAGCNTRPVRSGSARSAPAAQALPESGPLVPGFYTGEAVCVMDASDAGGLIFQDTATVNRTVLVEETGLPHLVEERQSFGGTEFIVTGVRMDTAGNGVLLVNEIESGPTSGTIDFTYQQTDPFTIRVSRNLIATVRDESGTVRLGMRCNGEVSR